MNNGRSGSLCVRVPTISDGAPSARRHEKCWFGRSALRASFATAITLTTMLACRSAAPADDVESAPTASDVVVEFRISSNGDHPIVPIGCFGKVLHFLVDMPRPSTAFDSRWRQQFGVSQRTSLESNGDMTFYRTEMFSAPRLRLGPLLPHLDEVAVAKITPSGQIAAPKIDGCLGFDVLRQFVVTLDFGRGVLQLRSSVPPDAGEAVALESTEDGAPAVLIALDGKRATPFVICTDTAADVMLSPARFAELRKEGAIRLTNPTIGVGELARHCAGGIVDEVSLGPFRTRNVAVNACLIDGLGTLFLCRYVVTLDLRAGKAYLKPGQDFERIDRLDRSGLIAISSGGNLVINRVEANSPAWEGGLLVGDVLRRVGEKPASEFSPVQLRWLFQTQDGPVHITVTRDDETLELSVPLRDYLDVEAEAKRRRALRASAGGRQPTATVLAEFDVGKHGGPLVVPVIVDGFEHPLNMLVDTGSARTIFEESLREKLGTSVGWETLYTAGDPRPGELVRIGGMTLGGVRLSHASTGVVDQDIGFFFALLGYDDLDGVLGMDMLREQIVQVDFDAGKLRLLSAIKDDIGQRIEFVYRPSGIPSLATTLGGLDQRWLIADTGAMNWSMCDSEVFSALAARDEVQIVSRRRKTAKPIDLRERWRVDRVKLGPFEHRNVGFATGAANAIGLSYLSRYLVTFDFPGGAIYLKPGELYDQPERRDLSGLQFLRDGGESIVYDVFPRSPARKVGIKVGDVILRIDGRDVMNRPFFELDELLSAAGKKHAIHVRRGGKELEFVLDLGVEGAKGK